MRAELLYGRLLATAAQHALGGGPPLRARVRSMDGTLEPLPLDRWLTRAATLAVGGRWIAVLRRR